MYIRKTDIAMVKIKRVYDPVEKSDGFRILVDRLWPRGLAKASASVDLWMKEVAPSTDLRKWFGHDPARWEGFQKKYISELRSKQAEIIQLKELEKEKGVITLLFGAKDGRYNQAVVLQLLLD